jgi:chaperonin GroES
MNMPMNSPDQGMNTQDGQQYAATETPEQESAERTFYSTNIAESLEEEELKKIGETCRQGFELDLQSRHEWERHLDEWTKLAMQVREVKTYPWPNASNVKYPLLSTASMQFNARAYPSLIPSDGKVVKGKVLGKDMDGSRSDTANRIATYMSYQFMHEMDSWDEDMDKLLMILPIIGTVFKKTYWDGSTKAIKSCLVLPKNLVINNWAKSVEEAERVSEIIEMSKRLYEERLRQKLFIDADLGEPTNPVRSVITETATGMASGFGQIDDTTPYEFIEQHSYLDLDDDGYQEPYIITFERVSGKVVRIVPRYEQEAIEMSDDQKSIAKITPTQYYTKFSFIPNPDGSFYDIGFGILLGPINEAVNSLINQLVDAGTLSNLQSGWIGKGLKVRSGENKMKPGEWIPVPSTGDDLRKQIVPLPAKDPSNVLFQLMGSMITSGKELASVAEIFVGKMPGQNTPATTTMATIEQGMKVFTAVYKRIYRALDKEFKKVYKLNALYLNPNTYGTLTEQPVNPQDFDDEQYIICPGADPTAVSQTEKLLKAQGLMELLPTGALDPIEVISRILQAQEQPNWEKLFKQEVQQSGQLPQQQDPKMLELQMKSQMDQQKFALQQQDQQFKQQLDQRDQVFTQQMKAMQQDQDARHEQVMTAIKAGSQLHADQAKVQGEAMRNAQQAQAHQQTMVQNHQTHQQKLTQMKETSKLASQQKTSKAGSKTK